jgi:peptide/nickel transport system substrate-binding protein
VIWLVAADYNTAALRFLSGGADFLDVVKPEFIARASEGGRHTVQAIPSLSYGYVAFNLRQSRNRGPHKILAERAVRRALVMAVDRRALVRNVFDTLGVVGHGPVTRAMTTSDSTIGLPFDTLAAGRALDSAGWVRGADGVRARRGVPLTFSLMVPTSSAIRMRFAVLLQEQWRRMGVAVRIDQLELTTFGSRLEARDFDAALNAWQIDPDPASVREEWMGAQNGKGGFNYVSYNSPAFNALADSAAKESDRNRSVGLYQRAYRQLTDDAPAMWLYELQNVFGVSKRIQPQSMRPDAWWANLADWRVNAKE